MKAASVRSLGLLCAGALIGWLGSQVMDTGVNAGDPEVESSVLATVGGESITTADVEEAQNQNLADLKRQVHQLTEEALERAIQIKMVRMEAKARGLETPELVEARVDGLVEDASDEEVADFYAARNLEGTLEELAPQIRAYLSDQARNTRYLVFLEELAAEYPVERFLQPLRTEVATGGFPSKGRNNAPVTIVEFSDFQCPYCRVLLATLGQVEEAYEDEVRFVFRQFPLISIHPDAEKAGEASLCARDQDSFWEMHDAMFENQRALGVDQLKVTARSLGMDGAEFDACLDSGKFTSAVTADLMAGQEAGVRGTPALFINGRFFSGAKPFEELVAVIEDELRRAGR
ncbi:MAG: hypothetical protein E4G90_06560 [Gemmatimonadales bacterium]|nr:MAG: hypothetical protein E4G90_06560 [Gemmatimonadales bacterium]